MSYYNTGLAEQGWQIRQLVIFVIFSELKWPLFVSLYVHSKMASSLFQNNSIANVVSSCVAP